MQTFKSLLVALCSFASVGLLSPVAVQAKEWKSAELITQQTFKYGAFEARIRAAKGSGFISTFFLWKDGSEQAGAKWQEQDFEIWGKNGKVQSQVMTPGNTALGTIRTEHTAIHTLPTLAYDHYYTYRMEWTPKHVAFFINGTLVREETDKVEFAKLLDSAQAEAAQLRTGLWAGDWDWSGAFDSTVVPQASFVNWLRVYSYTPGAGVNGSDFSLLWRDDFTTMDWSRWWSSNWTFDYSVSEYIPQNHGVVNGTLVSAFTNGSGAGVLPTPPEDDGIDLPIGTDSGSGTVVNPIAIPSTILATSYARALDMNAGNTGDQTCGTGNVDEEISSDTGGGCDVGWTEPNEWLEYDVSSASAATYDVSVRLASADGTGKLAVLVDGTKVGDVTAPSGGWQAWRNIAVGSIKLSAGNHVVRLVMGDPAKFNIRSIIFASETTVVPAQVTGLAATGDSTGMVSLSWASAPGATAYKVYRSAAGVTEAVVATVATPSYKDSGLVVGLVYTYRVVATNSVGDATTSSSVTVTPQAATLPSTVTGLVAVAGDAQVSLSWIASTGATSYKVYASSVGSDSLRATVATNSANISGLANGIPYTFYVVAVNSTGSAPKSSSVSATPVSAVTIPAQVTGLAATLDGTGVKLSWTVPTGATSYKVYRNDTLVSTVTTNAATVTGLTAGTSYSFRVAGVNATGTGTSSVSVGAIPTSAPTTPASVKVQYRAANASATVNGIQPFIKLVNTGTTAIPYSELTVRYWYTNEGGRSQSYWNDYSQIGSANVEGAFVTLPKARTNADTYLELSFKAAVGSLAAGASSGEIQSRFSKSDWSNYTQTNDASFSSTASSFVDWSKITVYRNGTLIWGTEP